MKKKVEFNIKKSIKTTKDIFISRMLDPYTAKIAKFLYNLGFSANLTTFITFLLGMLGIVVLLLMPNYTGLIIAAILITLRNIGDTVDGKIARGSGTFTPIGGFADIVLDWIFFHAAFFVAIGYLTNHLALGFLCVTGFMSREFTRRKFIQNYGIKVTETKEAKKLPFIVSLVKKYDLASAFWLIPILLLINPVLIIYIIAIIEYTLLFGELGFDLVCFWRKSKGIAKKE